jgi:hypothetical protein
MSATFVPPAHIVATKARYTPAAYVQALYASQRAAQKHYPQSVLHRTIYLEEYERARDAWRALDPAACAAFEQRRYDDLEADKAAGTVYEYPPEHFECPSGRGGGWAGSLAGLADGSDVRRAEGRVRVPVLWAGGPYRPVMHHHVSLAGRYPWHQLQRMFWPAPAPRME